MARIMRIPALFAAVVLLPVITDNLPSPEAAQTGGFATVNREATVQNLLRAYRGETTACAKYAAFAWKARQEGMKEIAVLFSAVSNSEHMHAKAHVAALLANGIQLPDVTPGFKVLSTRENLENAIAGETGEIEETYPEFMAIANREGDNKALESFNHAYKAEIRHKGFFEAALIALMTGKSNELPVVYSVCQVCGNTYAATPPKTCAICASPKEKFMTVRPF